MKTIGVITALPDCELSSILRVFDIPVGKKHDFIKDGERYWSTELTSDNGEIFNVIITCMCTSGNVESGLPTERLIKQYNPEFIAFVGIGCGCKKYSLGDVVTSGAVWAYEYIKTTEKGPLDRSRAKITSQHIQDDVGFFNGVSRWHNILEQAISKIDSTLLPRKQFSKPILHRSAWIASGEKVQANGELEQLNSKHDLIRVGEMEGYGFAVACEDRRPLVPWLIIRGISDYGDSSKDGSNKKSAPKKDEYHYASAQAAAAFLRSFLECGYTPSSKMEEQVDALHSERMVIGATKLEPTKDQSLQELEGIKAVFSSDYDPLFTASLTSLIRSARTNIQIVGMGLSFLKGNTELISAIVTSLSTNPSLRVTIYYGDPKNKGLKNRVEEENMVSNKSNISYNKNWPKQHLESIVKAFQNKVHPNELERFSIHLADCLPMTCIIRIDDNFIWYPYGTPNIRGKEAPWILITNPARHSVLRKFLEKNLSYYQQCVNSPSLLLKIT